MFTHMNPAGAAGTTTTGTGTIGLQVTSPLGPIVPTHPEVAIIAAATPAVAVFLSIPLYVLEETVLFIIPRYNPVDSNI
jgi:hypothetical protein